jgi:hypothetical protein
MDAVMYSYAQQTGHYFDRAHQGARVSMVQSKAAWRGSELAASQDWKYTLSGAQIAEIETGLDAVCGGGRPTDELSAADFPLPALTTEIARWRENLMHGRGFQVVSGVPVDRWPQPRAETFFWCIGQHLGTPGAQNAFGDLLGHVTDTGEDAGDPFVRLYRTASNIRFHCDAADVVGLLCLRAAASGGASRIVSSVSVFNELVAQRPDLAERLFEPFRLDIRDANDRGLTSLPIPPCRYADGVLRTFYHSDYFRSVVRHPDIELDDLEREALDVYEEIATSDDLYLDMKLAPGDIQWLSNHSILHARTAYTDHEDASRKRHLLRLWLSIPAD